MDGQPGREASEGVVLECLPNDVYSVQLESGRTVLAHLGQELRMATVRIEPGDRVRVEISPYDSGRGRISWRAPR